MSAEIATAPIAPTEQVLADALRDCWETMLGEAAVRSHVPSPPTTPQMIASLPIHGVWSGVLSLEADPQVAQRAAATLFATSPAELQQVDIRDAFGELANIIAGHVKAELGEPSRLGFATVAIADAQPERPTTGPSPRVCMTIPRNQRITLRAYQAPAPQE